MKGPSLSYLGEGHGVNKPHGELLNTTGMLYGVPEMVADKDPRECSRTHTQIDLGGLQDATYLQELQWQA